MIPRRLFYPLLLLLLVAAVYVWAGLVVTVGVILVGASLAAGKPLGMPRRKR